MRNIAAFLLAAATLLTAALAPAAASGPDAGPKRVVTLGGDVTEIVYALGEGKRLVGRDATSSWPEETAALPNVGYFRQLGAEGVLSLKPDLILATAQAGPAETLKQIAGTGVKIVTMPDSHSPDGLVRKVETVANALGLPEKGAKLAAELKQQAEAAQALIAAMPGRPKVLFIIAAGGGAPLAAGTQTAADAMVKLAGGENVFAAHTGYKAVSLEATAAAGPDAIVMMTQTLENLGGVSGVTEHPALRLTPAAKSGRVVARDGIYMLGFGPRLPQAMVEVARAIRGEEKK
jgi:iron complex transport system substrate-binding protein